MQAKMPWQSGIETKPDTPPYVGDIGLRLKQAREALELDVEAFYKPAGISIDTGLRFEMGAVVPRTSILPLRAICIAHGIPLSWLLFDGCL
jgi:hypothetical protein